MIEGVTARIVSGYSRVSDDERGGRFSSFMSGDGDDDRRRGERDAVPFKHQASTDALGAYVEDQLVGVLLADLEGMPKTKRHCVRAFVATALG